MTHKIVSLYLIILLFPKYRKNGDNSYIRQVSLHPFEDYRNCEMLKEGIGIRNIKPK